MYNSHSLWDNGAGLELRSILPSLTSSTTVEYMHPCLGKKSGKCSLSYNFLLCHSCQPFPTRRALAGPVPRRRAKTFRDLGSMIPMANIKYRSVWQNGPGSIPGEMFPVPLEL